MQSPQTSQMAIKLQPRACASCLKEGSQILTCDTLLMSHPPNMNASALSGVSWARAGGWRWGVQEGFMRHSEQANVCTCLSVYVHVPLQTGLRQPCQAATVLPLPSALSACLPLPPLLPTHSTLKNQWPFQPRR